MSDALDVEGSRLKLLSFLSLVDKPDGQFAIVTPYLTSVPLYGGLWMMACCSATLDPRKLSAPEIDRRIAQRGITDLQYYNGEMHRAALAMPNFVRALVS